MMSATATATLGHNSGTPADVVRDELGDMLTAPGRGASPDSLTKRRDTLIASAGRCVVTDNDSVGRAGDLLAMMGRLSDSVEQREAEIVEPYQLAVSAARTVRERWLDDMRAAAVGVRGKIDAFRTDQREKAQAAITEQAADEARRRAALAPRPELEPEIPAPKRRRAAVAAPEPVQPVALPAVKGDLGSRVGDRKVKTFSWADPRKVDIDILNHDAVVKAMHQACRDLARVRKTIRGVVITDGIDTTVRK